MDAYGGREGWCTVHGELSGLAFYTPDNVVDGMEDAILRNPWNRPTISIQNLYQYASLGKNSILMPLDSLEARPSTSLGHLELVALDIFDSASGLDDVTAATEISTFFFCTSTIPLHLAWLVV